MHPILFALFGLIALTFLSTFLGYLFGFFLIFCDLAQHHPGAAIFLLGALGTLALFLAGQPLWGCLALVLVALGATVYKVQQ